MTMLPEYKPEGGTDLHTAFHEAQEVAEEKGRVALVFNGGAYLIKPDETFDEWVRSPMRIAEAVPQTGSDAWQVRTAMRLLEATDFIDKVLRPAIREEIRNPIRIDAAALARSVEQHNQALEQ